MPGTGAVHHIRFFVLSHARVLPLTQREPLRFETMPSSPKPQAWRKDGGPVAGDRLAELDALPHRLVAAREQLAKAFSALLQPTRRCWLETYLIFQAFACSKELIE
jgi:hypothetical protein